MFKIKHARTADVVVAGFRWHKSGPVVGSLLLGLYDDAGVLHHVGVSARRSPRPAARSCSTSWRPTGTTRSPRPPVGCTATTSAGSACRAG